MSTLTWIKADPDNPPEHMPIVVMLPVFYTTTGRRIVGGLCIAYKIDDSYILRDVYDNDMGWTWQEVEKYVEITE